MTSYRHCSCSLDYKTSFAPVRSFFCLYFFKSFLLLPFLRFSLILLSLPVIFLLFLLSVASSSLSSAFSLVCSPSHSSSVSFVVTVKFVCVCVPPPLLSSNINPHLLLSPLHLPCTIGPAAAYGCLSHAMGSGLQLLAVVLRPNKSVCEFVCFVFFSSLFTWVQLCISEIVCGCVCVVTCVLVTIHACVCALMC